MASQKTISVSASRAVCKFPGCGQPAAPAEGPGRPPEYCSGRGHTRVSAWRERRRLAAEKSGAVISAADDVSPVTMAKMTGAELLRSLRAEADRITALGTDLRDRIDTLADPTAAEAEMEAVRAAAEQRAATAEAKAAAAGRRAAEADQFRAEADAAAEQISEELVAAQGRATAAEQRAMAAEADRDATVTKARTDTDAKAAAVRAERDTAIAQAQADAAARICAVEAERDTARQAAAVTETANRQAQQETARAQAAAEAAQAETGRVRAGAEQALAQARAEAAREREELRADLRARAERAERQADACRAELDRLRIGLPDPSPLCLPQDRPGAVPVPRAPSLHRRRGEALRSDVQVSTACAAAVPSRRGSGPRADSSARPLNLIQFACEIGTAKCVTPMAPAF